MPRGVFERIPTYRADDPALRSRVIAALRSMAVRGVAPGRDAWTTCRPPGLPSYEWVRENWNWAELRREAGLAQPTNATARELADPMSRPLEPWECIGEPELYAALPGGLPVCETPRDLGNGRVAWLVR